MGHRDGKAGGDHEFDIARLLHPANAFSHPMDVVKDADLTLAEKRALLASWAVCTEDTALNEPAENSPVGYDDVMDALKALARRAGDLRPPPRYWRILERRVPGVFGRKDDTSPLPPAS